MAEVRDDVVILVQMNNVWSELLAIIDLLLVFDVILCLKVATSFHQLLLVFCSC